MALISQFYWNSYYNSFLCSDGAYDLKALLSGLDKRLKEVIKDINCEYVDGGFVLTKQTVEQYLESPPHDISHYERTEKAAASPPDDNQKQESDCRMCLLCDKFGLSVLERDVLVVCMAPFIDSKYEFLYAFIQRNTTKKYATISLLQILFKNNLSSNVIIHDILNRMQTLSCLDLIVPGQQDNSNSVSFITLPLYVDKRIVGYVLGSDSPDEELTDCTIIYEEKEEEASFISEEMNNIISAVSNRMVKVDRKKNDPFMFIGPDHKMKWRVANRLCRLLNRQLLLVDCRRLLEEQQKNVSLNIKIIREAILNGYILFYNYIDELPINQIYQLGAALNHYYNSFASMFFVSAGKRTLQLCNAFSAKFVVIDFKIPDYLTRLNIWKFYQNKKKLPIDIDSFAATFKLAEEDIEQAIETAEANTFNDEYDLQLIKACKQLKSEKLEKLASKIDHAFTLKDIVLPEYSYEQLCNIITFYKYQYTIYDDWGFKQKLPYGRGLSILFSGPSGTGKTMAAGIIANELNIDAYRIDLSSVVSKYIGETEKNLSRIFDAAASSNTILFFDEADAIFGKRTDVKDAHDRYANIEVSYLLQMMEAYNGMTILTTNYRDNIDDAFTRRLKFIVEFPFPDEQYRKMLWEIAFPDIAPLDGDIDYNFLAKMVKATGGEIKLIALMAGMFGAQEGAGINMTHIMNAVKHEYYRTGKSFLENDFKPYFSLIKKAGVINGN